MSVKTTANFIMKYIEYSEYMELFVQKQDSGKIQIHKDGCPVRF